MAAYFSQRAHGEVGLIVTGGFAPNEEAAPMANAGTLTTSHDAQRHRVVTRAAQTKVARSHCRSCTSAAMRCIPTVSRRGRRGPISTFPPRALDAVGIEKQIADFVPCACVARVTRPISIVTRRDSTLSPASESFVEIRPGTDTARRSPARHAGWRRPPGRAAKARWYSSVRLWIRFDEHRVCTLHACVHEKYRCILTLSPGPRTCPSSTPHPCSI